MSTLAATFSLVAVLITPNATDPVQYTVNKAVVQSNMTYENCLKLEHQLLARSAEEHKNVILKCTSE